MPSIPVTGSTSSPRARSARDIADLQHLSRLEAQVRSMRRLIEADGSAEALIEQIFSVVTALRAIARGRVAQAVELRIERLCEGLVSDTAAHEIAETVRTGFGLPHMRSETPPSES